MIASYSRLLFAIILFIASLTSIYDWGRHYTLADVFTTLQSIALCLFLFSESRKKTEKVSLSLRGTISFIIVVGILGAVITWRHLVRGLWLDEASQFFFVDLAAFELPFSISAATQQQPSLDMYFQLLAMKIFGSGEIVVRFFPGIFFVLSVTQIWDLIKRKTHSLGITLLGVCFYLSSPYIQYFSLEGRPYILSVLLFTFFFRSAYIIVENVIPNRRDYLGFALSGGVFLSSIGFQPLLIVFCTLVVMFFTYSECRRSRAYYISAGYLLIAVTFIYWPIIVDSLHIEKVGIGGMAEGKNFLEILRDVWVGTSGGSYSNFYHYTLASLSLIAAVGVIIVKLTKAMKIYFFEIIIIAGVSILTALSFNYVINWPYVEKFSLLSNVLLIIFTFTALGQVLKRFNLSGASSRSLFVLSAISGVYLFLSDFVVRSNLSFFERENWRAFSENVQSKKPVGIAPLSLLDHIMPPVFSIYGHKIYFPHDEQIKNFEIKSRNTRGRSVLQLEPELFEKPLILAMPKIWSQDDLDPLVVSALGFGEFNDEDGFRYWYGDKGESLTVNFLRSIAWLYAGQAWTFTLLETMLVYYSSKNDQQMVSEIESGLWQLLRGQAENKKLGVKKLKSQQHEDYLQYFNELKDNVR